MCRFPSRRSGDAAVPADCHARNAVSTSSCPKPVSESANLFRKARALFGVQPLALSACSSSITDFGSAGSNFGVTDTFSTT
jgi:hypothetical protein